MTKDPLLLSQDQMAHRELFKRFCASADGLPINAIIDAAANLIINSMRQSHGTRVNAEKAFDELFGRMKALLFEHYNGDGRKKGVFPFDQSIEMPFLDFRKRN